MVWLAECLGDFISDNKAEQDVDHLVNHATYIADKIGVEHLASALTSLNSWIPIP